MPHLQFTWDVSLGNLIAAASVLFAALKYHRDWVDLVKEHRMMWIDYCQRHRIREEDVRESR